VGPFPHPVVTLPRVPWRLCPRRRGRIAQATHCPLRRRRRLRHLGVPPWCLASAGRPHDGPNPNTRVGRGATHTWWPASPSGHLRTKSQHLGGRPPRAHMPGFQSAQAAVQPADCPGAPAHRDAGALICP